MKKFRVMFKQEEYAEWINSCQNNDGGFGFKPGTTSFLESTYAAFTARVILKFPPRRLGKCEKFVIRCQAGNGGFGRQQRTVPSLESTYQVINSLSLINKLKC